jgi:dynein heavy chain, axonemal
MRSYVNIDNKALHDCAKPTEYKKLLFAYSLFHAIIQGRRKFGAIGWNIPYAFTNEDFAICQI